MLRGCAETRRALDETHLLQEPFPNRREFSQPVCELDSIQDLEILPAKLIPPANPFALRRLVPSARARTMRRDKDVCGVLAFLERHVSRALREVFRRLVLRICTRTNFPEALLFGQELPKAVFGLYKSIPTRLINSVAIGNPANSQIVA